MLRAQALEGPVLFRQLLAPGGRVEAARGEQPEVVPGGQAGGGGERQAGAVLRRRRQLAEEHRPVERGDRSPGARAAAASAAPPATAGVVEPDRERVRGAQPPVDVAAQLAADHEVHDEESDDDRHRHRAGGEEHEAPAEAHGRSALRT